MFWLYELPTGLQIMGQMLFATVNYSHTTCKYNTFIAKANNKFNILTSNRHPVTIPVTVHLFITSPEAAKRE